MPRARSTPSVPDVNADTTLSLEVPVKLLRARRSRARTVVSGEEATAPAPRRRSRKVAVPAEAATTAVSLESTEAAERAVEAVPRRKAPARVINESTEERAPVTVSRKRSITPVLVIGTLLIGGIGLSAAVGYTDKGVINVNQRMQEQSALQASNNGGDGQTQVIPVQNTSPMVPNGGLRGRGVGSEPAPPPPAEVATSTATSTEGVASSTSERTESTPAEAAASPNEAQPATEDTDTSSAQ